ncbi:MAG TPA: helix-turn-helix domain-containing protein [Bacillus sp. (in: firmicutes)]|nr:helix-turn-helix domain-containing protein [Bacillus sp. (in: firmicutes)]
MNIKYAEKQKAQELLMQGLKPKEVSSLLGVHISTIYNWKKELQPPSTSTIERTTRKIEKNLLLKTKKESRTKIENTDRKGDEIENEMLRKENEALKSKIKELEEVITDLVIKLKKTNENWLD